MSGNAPTSPELFPPSAPPAAWYLPDDLVSRLTENARAVAAAGDDLLLSREEVATILNVDARTVRRMVAAGTFPHPDIERDSATSLVKSPQVQASSSRDGEWPPSDERSRSFGRPRRAWWRPGHDASRADPRAIAAAVAALTRRARPQILGIAPPDDSLVSTLVAVAALARVGIQARPVGTVAAVYNPPLAYLVRAYLAQAGAFPTADQLVAWVTQSPENARGRRRVVTLGFEPPPGRQRPAHLVAIVAERWLADLSIDQVNAPADRIELEPLCQEVGADFLAGLEPLDVEAPGGVLITYRRLPEQGWEESPEWNTRGRSIGRLSSALTVGLRRAMREPPPFRLRP